MIRFVYGDHGCGKTEYIYSCIEKDAKEGREVLLLVPEQSAVAVERTLLKRLPASAQLGTEVTNFSRLCNRVFRKKGGLVCNYADEGVRRVTMQRALKSVGPLLSEYKDAAMTDTSLAQMMLSTSDEFAGCGIDGECLDAAVKKLPDGPVRRKLSDISTVIAAYRALLAENFDEPADDLARLAELDRPEDFFGEINVYFDGFSGLTGVQLRIMKLIMGSAAQTVISLPLEGPSFRGTDTESLKRMSDRLRTDAIATGKEIETVVLDTPYRYKSPELEKLAHELWTAGAAPLEGARDGSVRIISAADSYDEAESLASVIRKLVAGGMKYGDITVVARDAQALRGITDRALEEAGIPVFISEKTALSASAPARLLLSALKIISGGWQAEDVSSHIRTGLCGISADDCDLFEIYTAKWRISGRGFTGGRWDMNPDGYTDRLTDRGAAVLERVNAVKDKLCSCLGVLAEELKAAADCRDMCRALYNYMLILDIDVQMKARASSELAEGRTREAGEAARVYAATVRALDRVYAAYGNDTVRDAAEFSRALKTVLDSSYMGSIPVSFDAVTVGSADMLRADSPRCVILLGVYDGSFPAVPSGRGLLSSAERESLDGLLPLMRDSESDASDELYYLRRAISAASEQLIVYTCRDRSSVALAGIRRLLPGLKTVDAGENITDRIVSDTGLSAYSHILRGTPEAAAIEELARERGRILPSGLMDVCPVGSDTLEMSPGAAIEASGMDTILSQSKLQCFNECPFKYYCRYTLGLDPGGKADFSFASIGTFVHSILEHFLTDIYTKRGGVFPTAEEKGPMLDAIVADILWGYAPEGSSQRTARLEHMTQRLRFLADAVTSDILTELSDSDFVPRAFELKIGRGSPVPALKFRTKDGGSVSLEGVIDRVDVYEKGGKAWIRTVDYKTGTKNFKIDDIDRGENLQLLLYLFTLTRGGGTVPGVSSVLVPDEAAFTYLSCAVPKVEAPVDDPTAISGTVAGEMKRSGRVLGDEDIQNAVSHSGENRYLMKTTRTDSFTDKAGFDVLYEKVSGILTDRAEKIRSGVIAARPAHGNESCKNCEYASVCRSAVKM